MGCFVPDAPKERSYAQETADTLANQIRLAPDLYRAEASEAYGQPAYTRLALKNLNTLLYGTKDSQGLLDLTQQQATAQRRGDIQDVEEYGARATNALLASNPYQKALLDELNAQALSGLRSGNSLTPEEERLMQQSSRAAFAARGMGGTNAAVADEIARQMAMGDQLLRQRQAFGTQMAGVNQNVLGDPWLQILGRPSGAINAAQQTGTQSGASLFNPESPYAGNIYNANQQYAAMFTQPSTLGKMNMLFDSFIGKPAGAFGSVLGGAGALCWVAREVYGERDERWHVWRYWLCNEAPEWLRTLYWQHGAAFAAWLRQHPWAKPAVRWTMDWIVNPRMEAAT